MGKTRGERREFWRQHIQAWRQGELGRAAYCAEHGLNLQTFNVWVGRLRDEIRPTGSEQGQSTEGAPARGEAGTETASATFVPVEVAEEAAPEAVGQPAPAPIEVDVGGVTVRVPAEADAEVLTRVITAARRAP